MQSEWQAVNLSRLSTIGRWIAAVPAAALAFVLGFAVMAVAWQHFGGNAMDAYTWAISVATMSAALAGGLMVPPQHRWIARYIFIGIPICLSAAMVLYSLVEHAFKLTNVFDIAGSIIGGSIVWRILGQRTTGPYTRIY